VTNPAGESYTFAYHGADGLLASVTNPRGHMTQMSYDSHGRLSHEDGLDAGAWNLTRSQMGTTYAVTLTNAAGHKRIYQIDGVLVQGFLYFDDLRPAAELDGSNNIASQFIYIANQTTPAYMIRDGGTYRLLTDHLGSVRFVVDVDTGLIVQQIEYDAYGRVMVDTNPGFQPFGFAGGLYVPDTALVRFGMRDYDAETGRWTTKDPLYFNGGATNLYLYSRGDPVNWVDSDGRFGRLVALGLTIVAESLYDLHDRLTQESDEAMREASQAGYRDIKAVDALQHCIASCNVTREEGLAVSGLAGVAYEAAGEVGGALQPNLAPGPLESHSDLYNNYRGCQAGLDAEDREDCFDACVGFLEQEALQTVFN